jgi:hypothetical protein
MVDNPTLYPHRRNEDGSYDSTFLGGFATVANSRSEPGYAPFHPCDSAFLAERGCFSRAESMRHPPVPSHLHSQIRLGSHFQ